VLAPAIALLLIMAVSVGVVHQNNVVAGPRSPLDTPTLGSARLGTATGAMTSALDDSTTAALDDTIEAPLPAADDDAAAADPVVSSTDDADKPGPSMNATAVLSCLEDKCEPLVTQLGKTWRELGACYAAAALSLSLCCPCHCHCH
jgi:hypothetical protein